MNDASDYLANTVTAGPNSPGAGGAKTDGDTLHGSFGRYTIEGEIGRGAMGIVYRAVDPDLERAVALKVLRDDTNHEARARLLREARAMAKVSHPNVVAVHEVGSVGGRDFIAMELVTGTTVADWQRATQRSTDELLTTFVAAGNGLVAAHAKGVVHRDFKPHNILRSANGDVLVTDFGLARSVELDPNTMAAGRNAVDPMAQTLSITAPATTTLAAAAHTPTTTVAAELTQTGSLLGTPAYMSPEQWNNQPVGPAADQFAWAVAVWEALVGKRPFSGDSVEQLRKQILAGPQTLNPAALPRRLRPILLRGLATNPRDRFASMSEMLHAVQRARRKHSLAIIGLTILTASAVAVAVVIASTKNSSNVGSCPTPAISDVTVWSPTIVAGFRNANKLRFADDIEADVQTWKASRLTACKAEPRVRTAQLACLDGVMARIALAVSANQNLAPHTANFEPRADLIDPTVCNSSPPPTLTATWPTLASDVFALRRRADEDQASVTEAEVSELVTRAGDTGCLVVVALMLRAQIQGYDLNKIRHDVDQAAESLDRCNDDRLSADVANLQAWVVIQTPFADTQFATALRRAESITARIPEAYTLASLLQVKAAAARQKDHAEDAARMYAEAAHIMGARGLWANQLRSSDDAVSAWFNAPQKNQALISQAVQAGLPLANQLFGPDHAIAQSFKRSTAFIAWYSGDLLGASKISQTLQPNKVIDNSPTEVLQGTVINADGTPAVAAHVVAARGFFADAIDLSPFFSPAEPNHAVTDAAGHFLIKKAPLRAVVVAQLGQQRSRAFTVEPNQAITLRLETTSSISGRIIANGQGKPSISVIVAIPSNPKDTMVFSVGAPVAVDGTFNIDNVPIGRVRLMPTSSLRGGLGDSILVNLTAAPLRNIELDPNRTTRTVYAVVRGTLMVQPLGGQVIVVDANATFKNALEIRDALSNQASVSIATANPIVGEKIPKALLGKVQPGELVAEIQNVSAGPHRACGLGISGDVSSPEFWEKLQGNLKRIGVTCVDLGANQDTVVIEVPPLPKFE